MDRLNVKREQVREVLENRCRGSAAARLLVGHVMSVAPTCINAEVNVLELLRLFRTKGFRHLLVTDAEGRLIGVISDRDVLRCLGPLEQPDRDQLAQITAGQVMSTDLVTTQPRTDLEAATAMMIEHGISCLPVLAGETLVGIVTNTDLHLTMQVLLETLEAEQPDGVTAVG